MYVKVERKFYEDLINERKIIEEFIELYSEKATLGEILEDIKEHEEE